MVNKIAIQGGVGYLRWGWVFLISCLQNDFRKDPQVEPKFCRSLLTTKCIDVAPIGVVINIWNFPDDNNYATFQNDEFD